MGLPAVFWYQQGFLDVAGTDYPTIAKSIYMKHYVWVWRPQKMVTVCISNFLGFGREYDVLSWSLFWWKGITSKTAKMPSVHRIFAKQLMAETGSWLPLNLMNFGIDDVLEWKVQTCGCELMKLCHTIDFHKDQGGNILHNADILLVCDSWWC